MRRLKTLPLKEVARRLSATSPELTVVEYTGMNYPATFRDVIFGCFTAKTAANVIYKGGKHPSRRRLLQRMVRI